MPETASRPKIRFENVWQRFRLLHDRPHTLREAFISLYRQRPTAHLFEALKGISFTVPAGEALGIIGRNGSGKSTLLRIIARVFPPSAGVVEVNGHVSPLIELSAGFHPELTGRENIVLGGVLLGFTRAQMAEKLDRIVAFAELQEFIDTPVRQYSTGMLARLGFALATETEPDILLVDEVLAVGDEGFQHKCLERMNVFRRQGKTLVYVSHDMTTVASLCDRVLLLNQGEVLAEGRPEPVIARYHELLQ